jgi:hypothetical protein
MGISDPDTIIDLELAFYGQMGWFKVVRMEWNEAKLEKIIILDNTAESESIGKKRQACVPLHIRPACRDRGPVRIMSVPREKN